MLDKRNFMVNVSKYCILSKQMSGLDQSSNEEQSSHISGQENSSFVAHFLFHSHLITCEDNVSGGLLMLKAQHYSRWLFPYKDIQTDGQNMTM